MRYVATKKQLADILTKGSFVSATWLCLCDLLKIGPSFTSVNNKKEPPVSTISNKSNVSNNKGSMSHDVPVRIISNTSDVGIISNKPNNYKSNKNKSNRTHQTVTDTIMFYPRYQPSLF